MFCLFGWYYLLLGERICQSVQFAIAVIPSALKVKLTTKNQPLYFDQWLNWVRVWVCGFKLASRVHDTVNEDIFESKRCLFPQLLVQKQCKTYIKHNSTLAPHTVEAYILREFAFKCIFYSAERYTNLKSYCFCCFPLRLKKGSSCQAKLNLHLLQTLLCFLACPSGDIIS